MKYDYEYYVATTTSELINMIKEGKIRTNCNGIAHFKHLDKRLEERQDEHDNIKYAYASTLFKNNQEKSVAILKELIDKEHEPSMYMYALLNLKGELSDIDKLTSLELMKKSSSLGYAVASHGLSFMYYNGDFGFEKDLEKSFYYANLTIDQGYNVGYFQAGRVCIEKGNNVENYEKAVSYFEKVDIEKYHKKHVELIINANEQLGKFYTNGENGAIKDQKLGKKYMERAEEIRKVITDSDEE